MAGCPTQEEIDRIRRDFNITFAPGVDSTYACIQNSATTNPALTTFNLLRFFGWLRCTENRLPWAIPMVTPVVAASGPAYYDIYGFLRGLRLNWTVVPTYHAIAAASGNNMFFNGVDFARDGYRFGEMIDLAATVIHEVRHTVPGGGYGHPCMSEAMRLATVASGGRFNGANTCDPTLAWGGAYAAEYWFYWMLEHATPSWQFGDEFRTMFAERRNEIVRYKICDPTR